MAGQPQRPQDFRAAFQEITTEAALNFNNKYPQGIPKEWGGEGNYIENGIYYFSWSGIIKNEISQGANYLDPSHIALVLLSKFFSKEKENDGMVGRYSSHLGKVIRSDYSLDHADTINQILGVTPKSTDSVQLFTEHAKRLENIGI